MDKRNLDWCGIPTTCHPASSWIRRDSELDISTRIFEVPYFAFVLDFGCNLVLDYPSLQVFLCGLYMFVG